MITVVIVLIAVLLPLVIIAQTSQVAALFTSGRARNYALARNAATSLYSTIYQQANTNADPFLKCTYTTWPGYVGSGSVSSCPTTEVTNPSPPWPSSWSASAASSSTYNFVSFGPSGSLASCTTASGPCADFTVSYAPAASSTPPFANVVVDAFAGCSGTSALCVEVRYNAQLARETYPRWLWFNSHATVGRPGSTRFTTTTTPSVAYGGKAGVWTTGQVANGPVGTNGPNIYYCGTPTFFAAGGGSTGEVTAATYPPLALSPGCTTPTPPAFVPGPPPPGALPTTVQLSTIQSLAATESYSGEPSGSTPYALSGDATITFCPLTSTTSSIAISPSTCTDSDTDTTADADDPIPWPSSGVLYDAGNLTVSGTANEAITVEATGNVTIAGNLEAPLNEPSGDTAASDCTSGVSPSTDCPALVGIIAGTDITLSPSASCTSTSTSCTLPSGCSTTTAYGSQTVDAVLMAIGGDVSDAQWATQKACIVSYSGSTTSPSSLTYVGSIIENYQGMFGTGTQSDGKVFTGYATNNFYFDTRLSTQQPPSFPNPTNTHWLDLSLAEVPPHA